MDFKVGSKIEHNQEMLGHEAFFKERLKKVKDKLEKIRKNNRNYKIMLMIFERLARRPSDNLDIISFLLREKLKDLKDFMCMIQQFIEDIREFKDNIKNTSQNLQEAGKDV